MLYKGPDQEILREDYEDIREVPSKRYSSTVVSGDMVTHEYIHEVRMHDGREGQVPAVVVMELRNGRITQVRYYIDKLEAAKQMAKGSVAKLAVASIAKEVEATVNP